MPISKGDVMNEKYIHWEYEYPKHVVVRKENFYYVARNESAKVIHNILGYKLLKDHSNNLRVGGSKIEPIVEGLNSNKINYIIVEYGEITHQEEFESSCFDFKNSENISYNEESYIKKTEKFKDEKNLISFIDILLNGMDNLTSEKIEKDNIIKSKEMEKILLLTKKSINLKIKRKINKPEMSGSKWTEEEDEQLKEEYLSNLSIKEISKAHKRSMNSITRRIEKLKIDKIIDY